jgi:hypothetical protein
MTAPKVPPKRPGTQGALPPGSPKKPPVTGFGKLK